MPLNVNYAQTTISEKAIFISDGRFFVEFDLKGNHLCHSGHQKDEEIQKVKSFAIAKLEEHKQNQSKLIGQKMFVRFGALPTSGYSYNHRDSVQESGVSCYQAYKKNGIVYIDLRGVDSSFVIFNSDRPLYEVSGDLISDCGSDGEPLLVNAKKGKKINKYEVIF